MNGFLVIVAYWLCELDEEIEQYVKNYTDELD